MDNNQIKLLSALAKEIKAEHRKKASIVVSLTSAKILTPKEKFTSHYSNLGKAVSAINNVR